MITITSKFEDTAIVPAAAGGPYMVAQGSEVTLTAARQHPAATHEWDLGDGTTATGPAVKHTYPTAGFYIVKLSTVVNQPGGAQTRDFDEVRVENVAPQVNAGPGLTVNEGTPLLLSGSFTDPGWLDTHTATYFFGDDSPAEAAAVTEKHDPPAGTGIVSATHAWGDAREHTVLLQVRDDQGAVGQGTAKVTVLNVPPTVDAGPPVFAYPGSVITLEGSFTDPGWIETHEGTWDFGDGAGPGPATITEKHDPPAATGTVVASHIYQRLGSHLARCTVADDRGGIGSSVRTVQVVDLRNARFEDGYRATLVGSIANEWEPYAATTAEFARPSRAIAVPGGAFGAEELIVREGQRSQRIRVDGRIRAGLHQTIGANPGWCYEVTGGYCLFESPGGMARLGVDPAGGSDPTASGIVWATGRARGRWQELVVRVAALQDGITIFLEAAGTYRLTRVQELEISRDPALARVTRDTGAELCFDHVRLIPIQPFCAPERTSEAPPVHPNDPPPDRGQDPPPDRPPARPPHHRPDRVD
ncbi:MAG: PKD domain-containing protein [Vicinamibacteria bacterium]